MNKPLKIVWLCPYPLKPLVAAGLELSAPYTGHPGSWLVNLTLVLGKRPEIELHVITLSALVPRDQLVKKDGVFFHVLRHGIPFTTRSWDAISQLNARTSFKSGRKRLARKLAELKPDVVHGHGTEEAYGLAAVESPFISVVSVQGVISRILEVFPCLRYQLTAPRERECIEKGKNFMCRTHFDKGFVQEINPAAHIFHVAEAMGPIFFQPERRLPESRILFVGGYGEAKGLKICLDAFARIHEKNPNVYLDVVGGGSDADFSKIQNAVLVYGLKEVVRFYGWLDAEELAKLQAGSRVFAMTSKCENSPNVLAEALCSGTPCVAFDVGGVASMFVDGESGYLIPPGEIEQFANAALQLLSDDDCWQSFSEKARMFSQVNRPEAVADASIEVYKILSQTHPAEEI